MLVRRDERRRAFGRDVGTLRDVRGEERSFRRRERHAPMLGADDAGLTRSAGEVWIRSGGSGVTRAEAGEEAAARPSE